MYRRAALTTFSGIPRPVEGVAVAGHYLYLSIMPGALLLADAIDPAACTWQRVKTVYTSWMSTTPWGLFLTGAPVRSIAAGR